VLAGDLSRPGLEACPYPARASSGGQSLASTHGAVRLQQPGRAPTLWFPVADVARDACRRAGVEPVEPPPGTDGDALAGRVAFDHDEVLVEVVDERPGDEARDVTVKRFPTWGDAADLVDQLDVRREGATTYVGGPRSDWRRPVVEASLLLGQSLVAASRHAPGRRVVSAHLIATRAADAHAPVQLEVDELSAGRTFTAVTVDASQAERRCAHTQLLLDATASDVVRHTVDPPDVAGPYESAPCDMGVTGRDLRIVDDAYTSEPDAPVGPPVLDAWVRFRDLPDDPALHAALLAQFTGHLSIAAALRPHAGIGQAEAHHTLSTAINAIDLSLHAEVRADRWLLYHHLSTFAGDGMTHAECRVHDEAGRLVASFAVEAMVRRFDRPPTDGGRTAL
jgi:acyl-CoA thioesterase